MLIKMLMRFVTLVSLLTAIPGLATPIRAGQYILRNQIDYSDNTQYRLVMQTGGNLVLYRNDSSVAWSTQTFVPGTSAVMQADGNFVLYTPSGQPVWHTQTSGNPGAFFNVQDDGNLVAYSSTGHRCGTRGQTSCQEETPNTLATLWEEI
jgi:hypothetical protein